MVLPSLEHTSIISISRLLNHTDGTIQLWKDGGAVLDKANDVVADITVVNGIYELMEAREMLSVEARRSYLCDHYRFGHPPLDILKRITKRQYKDVEQCKASIEGKLTIKRFNHKKHQDGFNKRGARTMSSDTHGPYPGWTLKDTGLAWVVRTLVASMYAARKGNLIQLHQWSS